MIFNFNNLSRKERFNRVLSFRDLLPEIIKRSGLRQPLTMAALQKAWPDITGDSIAAYSSVESVNDNTLFVKTKHPIFANEISLMKNAIMSKINERFKISLKEIKFLR